MPFEDWNSEIDSYNALYVPLQLGWQAAPDVAQAI
jgi:hypothetical protein